MLVTAKEMLKDAQKRGYAVCAPNFFDYETAKACIEVGEELNAPILLDYAFRGKANVKDLCDLIRLVAIRAEQARVPVCVQQDHGKSYEACVCCIHAGFTSIMADFSSMSFEDNCRNVRELVKIAHACEISIEAELGHVGEGKQYETDGVTNLTEVKDVVRFVEETGCDSLAVAIGTAHGAYSGEPHVDFDRLAEIRAATDIPLVLHGGSSTGDEKLARAARSGISKINIATDIATAGADTAIADRAKGIPDFMFRANYLKGYKAMIRHYAELFGSADKAAGWGAE